MQKDVRYLKYVAENDGLTTFIENVHLQSTLNLLMLVLGGFPN